MKVFGLIVMVLLDLFFLFAAIASKRVDYRKSKWPRTYAIIKTSTITSGPVPSSETGSDRVSGFRWILTLEYEYAVDGKTILGDQVHSDVPSGGVTSYEPKGFDPDLKPHEWLQKFSDEYPVGARVPVFYNPKKPESSFLIYENRWGFFFTCVGMVIILTIGSWAIDQNIKGVGFFE